MTRRQYTPEEIKKVLEQIEATRIAKGYKPMWAKKEMEHRAEKAEHKGSFYGCGTDSIKLGWNAYNIAKGDDTVASVYEALKDEWEMYQEMAERYEGN